MSKTVKQIRMCTKHFEMDGYYENTVYYLCIRDDGTPFIEKQIFTPGISAGNCGGGEFREDLPKDFLVGCDLEKISDELPLSCYEQVLKNKELEDFLLEWNRNHAKK